MDPYGPKMAIVKSIQAKCKIEYIYISIRTNVTGVWDMPVQLLMNPGINLWIPYTFQIN